MVLLGVRDFSMYYLKQLGIYLQPLLAVSLYQIIQDTVVYNVISLFNRKFVFFIVKVKR